MEITHTSFDCMQKEYENNANMKKIKKKVCTLCRQNLYQSINQKQKKKLKYLVIYFID